MKAREFISRLEEDYPLEYALEWDNVGLLLGNREKEIRKIYIALDVTKEVLRAAIASGADMVLTHHPLMMKPIRRITGGCFLTRAIMELLQQDMLCYAMHTNYDVLRMGKLASAMLGLEDAKPLDCGECREENLGIGEIGTFAEPITLQNCAKLVKDTFTLNDIKIFGDVNQQVQRIAVVPGSGKSTIRSAVAKGAEVLITGDIGHHDALDALEENLMIIDAGHYGTEHIFLADMKAYVNEHFAKIQVETHPITQPFCTI